MAKINGREVKDVAAERRANIKKTGGFPPKPAKDVLGNDARQILIRKKAAKDLAGDI